jgi:hypothetical protein
LIAAMAFGLAWTAQSEWVNVHVRGTWAYDGSMPLVAGVGVKPLLQWLLLPPVALRLVRATVIDRR